LCYDTRVAEVSLIANAQVSLNMLMYSGV
jgi:hypothetical protein